MDFYPNLGRREPKGARLNAVLKSLMSLFVRVSQ